MFLNPIMLAGLGGALLPLVLHLLARSRYRNVEWGAMMFLESQANEQRQAAKLKQWLLLAMRMATVALLAIALARPITRSAWGAVSQQGPVTAVIVLDCSHSMSTIEDGRPRFEQAREAAMQVISSLRPGDKVALVLGGEVREVPFPEPTADLQAVARQITELRSPTGMADLATAMDKGLELAARAEQGGQELYVIADRQAFSWRGASDAWASAFARQLNEQNTRLVVVPVGGQQVGGVSIEAVRVLNAPIIRETPCELEITIRARGNVGRTAVPLELAIRRQPSDAPKPQRKSVVLEPGGVTTVRTSVVFPHPGSWVLGARLELGDGQPEATFDLAVNVVDRLRVLILSGDERKDGGFRNESALAALALVPVQNSSFARVDVAGAEDWPGGGFGNYAAVILANVPQVSAAQARSLEQYVYEGGGLILAPGNLVRVDNYNALLWRNGLGISPARLGELQGGGWADGTTIGGVDQQHPIFQSGVPTSSSAVVAHWFDAIPKAEARILASYSAGGPYAIEESRGRGRVVLLTTPLDLDWNNLPLSSFYLPLLQSTVRYLGGSVISTRNLLPGEMLVTTVPGQIEESATVRLPQDRPMERGSLSVRSLGDRTELRFTDTRRPGWYRLTGVRGGDLVFVVQLSPEESDLSAVPEQRWEQLRSTLGFEQIEPRGQALAESAAGARGGRELWLACLLAVVGLSAAELWAAGRFGGRGEVGRGEGP